MKKRNKKSPEQLAKDQLVFQLSQLREEVQNTPTILYEVGQEVEHGATDESHVTEVLDDGKILKLHQTCTNTNYGRPFKYERDMYVAWHDIRPATKVPDSERIHSDRRLRMSYYQTSLSGLLGRHYHFRVDFDPEYQRQFVWTLEDKQALIESIFKDVDIGKFVFRKLPFAPHPAPSYEIVDGKQRLNAIHEFYEGRFKWRGRKFHDLHPRDRNHFREYPVSVADLTEDTSRKEILELFIRLNTSGRAQDPKHLARVQTKLNELES